MDRKPLFGGPQVYAEGALEAYSLECVEEEFSEVHIHHAEYPSLSGWCYAAFSRSHR